MKCKNLINNILIIDEYKIGMEDGFIIVEENKCIRNVSFLKRKGCINGPGEYAYKYEKVTGDYEKYHNKPEYKGWLPFIYCNKNTDKDIQIIKPNYKYIVNWKNGDRTIWDEQTFKSCIKEIIKK